MYFETDFNYDDQTSSSNSPGPSVGDGSSGRGYYRNAVTEAVVGSRGDFRRRSSHGRGRNDRERRNDNQRQNHNERRNDNRERDNTLQDNLRHIACTTLEILDDGEYFPPGKNGPYDLLAKILWTNENTRYYGPNAGDGGEILESEFLAAANSHDDDNDSYQTRVQASVSPDPQKRVPLDQTQTTIYVGGYSTLVGARKVHFALARNPDPSINKKIGVLNFASAKKPGGEFINGSRSQEESLARASTLYPSLITEAAYPFYSHYHDDPSNAYHTHAMVYSPGIVLIRDDNGEWRSPVEVDVLTSAAVNAGEIRQEGERKERLRLERMEMEYWKNKGGKKRNVTEKAMAEREEAVNNNEKEEIAKLKKEQAILKEEIATLKKEQANFVKEMGKRKEMDEGKAKDSGNEKEEPFVGREKSIAEVENENEEWEEVEKPEEHQENTIDSPDSGLECGSDGQLKDAESQETLIQDDQALFEVNQEPTSSSSTAQPLTPPTQPSQAPDPDPNLTYAFALENAEIQIQETMYARISRILHVFQLHQTPHLILGSFGTGVFKNRIELVATIFADLLIKPGGRFKDVFRTVVFAILGKETLRIFTQVFLRADKRAQREGTGKPPCIFEDSYGNGGDGDVKEGDKAKTMRMRMWKARRKSRNSLIPIVPDVAADAASITDPRKS